MSALKLSEMLPNVKGRYDNFSDLSNKTWFGVGGPAEVLFTPANADDLSYFFKEVDETIPIMILGLGSNLLVRDGGVPGVTIKLGQKFSFINIKESEIICGGGVSCPAVASKAQKNEISGMEFLTGIPGSVGGAIRMNAGAYGEDIRKILISVEVLDSKGNLLRLSADELDFQYRRCNVPKNWVFISANFRGIRKNKDLIKERMKKIRSLRLSSQPIKSRTSGSTFVNPSNIKAWELIEKAGCRGLNFGNASVSQHHCNFLVNNGNASAMEIENLGEEIRKRVFNTSGIQLSWEIIRVGVNISDRDSLLMEGSS